MTGISKQYYDGRFGAAEVERGFFQLIRDKQIRVGTEILRDALRRPSRPQLKRQPFCATLSRAMSPQEYARLATLIAHPPPGSKLAAAKEFGIDLTLLVESLRLTPTERLEKLDAAREFFLELRRAMHRARNP
jgi:hypothetical protein